MLSSEKKSPRKTSVSPCKEHSPKKLELFFTSPAIEDGHDMFELVKNSPPLDPNSLYAYLMLAQYFSKTSLVAKTKEHKLIAFVSGFVVQERPNTLFIWQIVVDKKYRGQGLAGLMLQSLLNKNSLSNIRYIETSISPSNQKSYSVFDNLAKNLACPITEIDEFNPELFGKYSHESELVYKIGPFDNPKKKKT